MDWRLWANNITLTQAYLCHSRHNGQSPHKSKIICDTCKHQTIDISICTFARHIKVLPFQIWKYTFIKWNESYRGIKVIAAGNLCLYIYFKLIPKSWQNFRAFTVVDRRCSGSPIVNDATPVSSIQWHIFLLIAQGMSLKSIFTMMCFSTALQPT